MYKTFVVDDIEHVLSRTLLHFIVSPTYQPPPQRTLQYHYGILEYPHEAQGPYVHRCYIPGHEQP